MAEFITLNSWKENKEELLKLIVDVKRDIYESKEALKKERLKVFLKHLEATLFFYHNHNNKEGL